MNKTTLTIKIDNTGEKIHPVHLLLHDALVKYNQENDTKFFIKADVTSSFNGDNVVSITGNKTARKIVILNPTKHLGGSQ